MTRERGLLFDKIAEEYDRVRPDYPAALVDAACSIGGLTAGSTVVEVGCGTGKLTTALVERGLHVDAVDPGAELVEVARRRLRDAPVRFHLGRFEDVDLPSGAFAAVFSATAFHWVDPSVSWSKAASLLPPGGMIALISHVGAWTELEPELLEAWRSIVPEAAAWGTREPEVLWEGAEARRVNVSEVWSWLGKHDVASSDAAALFGDARLTTAARERVETGAEFLALTRTTSGYLSLDVRRRNLLERRLNAVFERVGGSHRATVYGVLVTAMRR